MRLLPATACLALSLAMTLGGAAAHAAEEPGVEGLPTEAVARGALETAPAVVAARESIATGEAQDQRRRAGPYEWEVAMTTQRRTDPAGIRYDEQQYELTRRLRLPGKLLLDRRIGEVERDVGQFAYADAWHEAGRDLLATWFELVRQARRVAQLQEQQTVATRSLDAIRRRVAAGDAPRVDAQLAEAEQGRLAARALEAARQAELARIELAANYPSLAQHLPTRLEPPPEATGSDLELVRHIVGHNHEVELAEGRARTAELLARRAGQDRMPDPSVGVQYSDNLDGNRRVLGLRVAVPLGLSGRGADAALARSTARRAAAEAAHVRLRVEADARAAVLGVRSARAQWERLETTRRQSQAAAEAVARGYELGELDIASLLAARRMAAEAAEEAEIALVTLLEAGGRLRLDSHELWALAEPEH